MPSLEMVSRREEGGGEYEWLVIEDVEEVIWGLLFVEKELEKQEEEKEEEEDEEEEGSFKGTKEVVEEEEEEEEESGWDKSLSSWSKSSPSSAGV
jgi:hypothetical protein